MLELLEAGCAELGIPRAPGDMARLMAYARSVAHFPTALKEVRATASCDNDLLLCIICFAESEYACVHRPVPLGLFDLSLEAGECTPLSAIVE